jgi:hypothetical protein
MNGPPTDPIATARRLYAEELRFTAHVRSPAVVAAFAVVPRWSFCWGPALLPLSLPLLRLSLPVLLPLLILDAVRARRMQALGLG